VGARFGYTHHIYVHKNKELYMLALRIMTTVKSLCNKLLYDRQLTVIETNAMRIAFVSITFLV